MKHDLVAAVGIDVGVYAYAVGALGNEAIFTEVPDMPGTGGELAEHLIEKLGLEGVLLNLLISGITMTPTIGWFA